MSFFRFVLVLFFVFFAKTSFADETAQKQEIIEKAKEISERCVKVTIKPDNSPVTDGDIEVDNLLIVTKVPFRFAYAWCRKCQSASFPDRVKM